MTNYDELVKRLLSNAPLPICPFDKRSPEYWTTPNDKPCKFCGGEPEGPDKCTGADTRIMTEAADAITRLQADLKEAVEALKPFVVYVHDEVRESKDAYRLEKADTKGGGWIGAEDFRRAAAIVAKHEGKKG